MIGNVVALGLSAAINPILVGVVLVPLLGGDGFWNRGRRRWRNRWRLAEQVQGDTWRRDL